MYIPDNQISISTCDEQLIRFLKLNEKLHIAMHNYCTDCQDFIRIVSDNHSCQQTTKTTELGSLQTRPKMVSQIDHNPNLSALSSPLLYASTRIFLP